MDARFHKGVEATHLSSSNQPKNIIVFSKNATTSYSLPLMNKPRFSDYFRDQNHAESPLIQRFRTLIEPMSESQLESMAGESHRLTRQYFGKTMRLFAPLYLSNECVNICKYCGFSRDNPILRTTLEVNKVEQESKHLANLGFRNILLVAGEHPRFVSESYLADCITRLRTSIPSLSLEIGPMETEQYLPLVQAGAEGLVVYQETYHRGIYQEMHTAGPKKDFDWRLDCPERAYEAGFKRIGIGALIGLAPWKEEVVALARHAEYLLKNCWKSFLTISLPRLRPAAGEFEPRYPMTDRELVQLICALRMTFPQIGLVLSTREPVGLRNGLFPLGITHISAGSHTEPGGYTGVEKDQLHRTEKGIMKPLIASEGEYLQATEQFQIADERSPSEISNLLRSLGLEPVWKDWEECLSHHEELVDVA
jgi:2-iminoacetate synthase